MHQTASFISKRKVIMPQDDLSDVGVDTAGGACNTGGIEHLCRVELVNHLEHRGFLCVVASIWCPLLEISPDLQVPPLRWLLDALNSLNIKVILLMTYSLI